MREDFSSGLTKTRRLRALIASGDGKYQEGYELDNKMARKVPMNSIEKPPIFLSLQSELVLIPVPERTGNRSRNERYCTGLGRLSVLRSRPAGLMAEVGLRWCGAKPSPTNEGSRCQSLLQTDRIQNLERPRFRPSRPDGRAEKPGQRAQLLAQSNRA